MCKSGKEKITFLTLKVLFCSLPALADVAVVQGWNLIGNDSGAVMTVAQRFADPTQVSTVWKWNATTKNWSFFAPSLSATDLSIYAANKGYEVLSQISPGDGFWVNSLQAFTFSTSTQTAVTKNAAEGLWRGTVLGNSVDLLVLSDGESWAVESYSNSIQAVSTGAIKVTGSEIGILGIRNSYFSSSGLTPTSVAFSFSGAMQSKATLQATSTLGTALTATYVSEYQYPATLDAIAGEYTTNIKISGMSSVGFSPGITIDASGIFFANSYATSCNLIGKLKPDSTTNRFYKFEATNVGALCSTDKGVTFKGVAYIDTANSTSTLKIYSIKSNGIAPIVITATKYVPLNVVSTGSSGTGTGSGSGTGTGSASGSGAN